MRLVISDQQDPDDVGFVQWRVGFYVAGDLNNFLLLLDDWFAYKAKSIASAQPFQVQMLPHVGVEVTVADDFAYEHIDVAEPAVTLPLGIFKCQPCIGKRIVTLNLQIEDENTISVVITGNTWAFRSRLDTFGISGGYQTFADDRRIYCRVLKNIDLEDDAQQERVLSLVGEAVFKNLAMRVTVDKTPEADTNSGNFVSKMREIPCLHFESPTSPDAKEEVKA